MRKVALLLCVLTLPPVAGAPAASQPAALPPDLEAAFAAAGGGPIPVLAVLREPVPDPAPAFRPLLGDFEIQRVLLSADLPAMAARLNEAQARALAGHSLVEFIQEDRAIVALEDPSISALGVGKARLDFEATGDADGSEESRSKGDVGVALLDTGVDAAHAALAGRVIAWRDLVGSRTAPYDDNGHGTHVAGTVAAVAPGASLVVVKVLDAAGGGRESDLLAGIDWVVERRRELGVRVLSLSVGTPSPSNGGDALSLKADAAVAAGLVVVAAAGNSGPGPRTVGAPGAAASVLTVGAIADASHGGVTLAKFSSRGPALGGRVKPDVVAPGVGIESARAGTADGTALRSGTSMATPFVAGVAALLLDADPALPPADVKRALESTAEDFGPVGKDSEWGSGVLRPHAALASVAGATGPAFAPLAHSRRVSALPGAGATASLSVDVAQAGALLAGTLLLLRHPAERYDFDLALEDPSGTVVASSKGLARQEDLTVRAGAPGTYRWTVTSAEGSGPFTLDVTTETPDVEPPVVFATPEKDAVEAGDAARVVARVDDDRGVARVRLLHAASASAPLEPLEREPLRRATRYSFDLDALPAGTHRFRVHAEDASGNAARSGEVTITVRDTRPPRIANLTVEAAASGAVVRFETDEPATATVEYGRGRLTTLAAEDAPATRHAIHLGPLDAGARYLYRVRAVDADGLESRSARASFLVPRAAVELTLSARSLGREVALVAQLTLRGTEAPVAGAEVRFQAGGAGLAARARTGADGAATVHLPFPPGEHGATARFGGSARHEGAASAESRFVVKEDATRLALDAASEGRRIRAVATLSGGDDDLPARKRLVRFLVDGQPAGSAVTDAHGRATWTRRVAEHGEHRVEARYAGGGGLLASETAATIVAAIRPARLEVEASGMGSRIEATARLASGDEPVAGRIIRFHLDGERWASARTGPDGTATVRARAGFGPHALSAGFAGDDAFAPAAGETTFVHEPAQTRLSLDVLAADGKATLRATLVAVATGRPVPGQSVTFDVDGLRRAAATNATGVARVVFSLPAGPHAAQAAFAGRGGFLAAEAPRVGFEILPRS